jgi:hypothetical protein
VLQVRRKRTRANHKMGGTACTPPKTKRVTMKKTPFREPAATERTQGYPATAAAAKEATPAVAAAAIDGRREAMDLAQ